MSDTLLQRIKRAAPEDRMMSVYAADVLELIEAERKEAERETVKRCAVLICPSCAQENRGEGNDGTEWQREPFLWEGSLVHQHRKLAHCLASCDADGIRKEFSAAFAAETEEER